MRIYIFCFSLLIIAAGGLYAAEVPKEEISSEFIAQLIGKSDGTLTSFAAGLSDTKLAQFGQASRKFYLIAQAEFVKRPSYLWAKGETTKTSFHAHRGEVLGVFVTSDQQIVSVGADHRIYVWQLDGDRYKEIKQITDDVIWQINGAFFSPSKNILVLRHKYNIINVWDVKAGTKIQQFEGHHGWEMVLSPDGTTLAESIVEGSINLWDVITGTVKVINTEITVGPFTFSPDGTKLAFARTFRPLVVWNLKTNAKENQFEYRRGASLLSFLPNGKIIAYEVSSLDSNIRVWDVTQKNKLISTLDISAYGALYHISLSHNNDILAAYSRSENKVILWHTQSGKIIRELPITLPVANAALTFSPDDKMLVAGCITGDIITWKVNPPEKKK